MNINIVSTPEDSDTIEMTIRDKTLLFDSDKCIGTLIAFDNESTAIELRDAFQNVKTPENVNVTYFSSETFKGCVDEVISVINNDYDEELNSFIVMDFELFNTSMSTILKIIRDGSVRFFIIIPEKRIDIETCNVRGIGLGELNNPFIIQNIVYVDDHVKRLYDTKSYYNNKSKKKVI